MEIDVFMMILDEAIESPYVDKINFNESKNSEIYIYIYIFLENLMLLIQLRPVIF